jgi:hypothetical protein
MPGAKEFNLFSERQVNFMLSPISDFAPTKSGRAKLRSNAYHPRFIFARSPVRNSARVPAVVVEVYSGFPQFFQSSDRIVL